MPRREDDDIEIMDGLSVDRDDARYRGKQAADKAPLRSGAKASAQGSGNSASHKSGRGWLLIPVVILLLILCGVIGYRMLQLEQQLSASNGELTEAIKRLDQLSQEVYVTGSSVTESGTAVEKKFKFFDSEIRKLWDVSNKRNKAAIKKNSEQVKALSSSLKKTASQVSTRDRKVGTLEKEVVEFGAQLKRVNSQLMAENTTLRAMLEDHSEQMLLLRGELELMQKRLSSLPNNLGQRVALNEEAIEAIDAARRQLVSNITQLQNRVNQLHTGQ